MENLRDGVESFVILSKNDSLCKQQEIILSSAIVVMVLMAMLSYICWTFEGLMYSFTLMLKLA